ncbi:transposase [Microtetraspora glauca]|uniref:Transposase n=1 Tax=Microtetraspora glauca TaxID=1996 RepID=A0ABV3GDH4_MICGL
MSGGGAHTPPRAGPELERPATTVQTWWPEICAFIRTGITNASSEGTNRVIKTVVQPLRQERGPERVLSPEVRISRGVHRAARRQLSPAAR